MTVLDEKFEEGEAPCGQTVDGVRHEERDPDCLLTDSYYYSCGCRRIRHQYHDGSYSRKVIHHNGKILVDELLGRG